MKVRLVHDGNGNFPGAESFSGLRDETTGLQFMLASVAQGVGEAFVHAAGRRGKPMGRCSISVESAPDRESFAKKGLLVTVEAQGEPAELESMVSEALSHCFPAGSLACPLRHTVIALARS